MISPLPPPAAPSPPPAVVGDNQSVAPPPLALGGRDPLGALADSSTSSGCPTPTGDDPGLPTPHEPPADSPAGADGGPPPPPGGAGIMDLDDSDLSDEEVPAPRVPQPGVPDVVGDLDVGWQMRKKVRRHYDRLIKPIA